MRQRKQIVFGLSRWRCFARCFKEAQKKLDWILSLYRAARKLTQVWLHRPNNAEWMQMRAPRKLADPIQFRWLLRLRLRL